MMDTLLALDRDVFLLINHLPHTPATDTFAMTISGVFGGTMTIWLLFSILLFFRAKRRDLWFFLPVGLAAGLSVLVTEVLLKNYFTRNRPPLDLGTIQLAAVNGYSFPSGHATFAWALAVVLARVAPRAKYFFYTLATLIALSRIYLGVHYPADIMAGSVIGIAIGTLALWVKRNMVKYTHAQTQRKRTSHHARGRRSGKSRS